MPMGAVAGRQLLPRIVCLLFIALIVWQRILVYFI